MDEERSRLRAVLATTPARWLALTGELPDELLQRAPAPGEWSAVDCLRHLRDVEQDVFQERVRAFRAGETLVPYDPEWKGSPPGESPADLAADLARRREASLALLAEVQAGELALTAHHPEYGRDVRLGELLTYWAAHDLMHTVQAERALMQPFIEGAGPWRVMTADHDIAARGA